MKFQLIENHENEWMLCLHEDCCIHRQELRPLDILRLVDQALFCNEVSISINIESFDKIFVVIEVFTHFVLEFLSDVTCANDLSHLPIYSCNSAFISIGLYAMRSIAISCVSSWAFITWLQKVNVKFQYFGEIV